MKKALLALGAAALLGTTSKAEAQIDFFGYFQGTFNHTMYSDETLDPINLAQLGGDWSERNGFSLQQMNLIGTSQIEDDISAYINLEFTNTYQTRNYWGEFGVEEAWMRYDGGQEFRLKAGLLVPEFNQMNTQKTKFPLLPWILRPLVYEASIYDILNPEPFLPLRAFVEASGSVGLSDDAKLTYAAHIGPSSNIPRGEADQRGSAGDTTTYLSFGGRVGAELGDLIVGVSGTMDHHYLIARDALGQEVTVDLGNVPRMRIGGDISYSIAGFNFLGEVIYVTYSLTDEEQAMLDAAAEMVVQPLPDGSQIRGFSADRDRLTYFGSLSYDITEKIYAMGMYSFWQDNGSRVLSGGLTSYSFGGGYRVSDGVVVKLTYSNYQFKDAEDFNVVAFGPTDFRAVAFSTNIFHVATSVVLQ